MKKFSTFSLFTISALILSSCSHIKRSPRIQSPQVVDVSETVEIDDAVNQVDAKSAGYTHEMAEANANDEEIMQKVGSPDIDQEVADNEQQKNKVANRFLLAKKTKRMEFWVDYFTNKQRDRFQRFINNGEEYRHHIEEIFAANGLPKELYFVGLIESGYYLGARSHAAAVGPWQFIKGTGKRYGLKITPEIDERQDLFKATHSAAQYFKDLHNIFSSWELSLSAYNAGEYGIIRRIMKHGTRDFYKLSKNKQLPTETINYVPKVLAAMHVVNNAEKYGFVIPTKSQRLFDHTELVAVKKNQSINAIASRLGVSAALLKRLNPELRRNSTPKYFAGTYHLRVPSSTKTALHFTEINNLDDSTESAPITILTETKKNSRSPYKIARKPQFHKVRRGDTLVSISRKYETTPRKLAQVNHFKSWKTKIKIGQRIMLEEQTISTAQSAHKKVKVSQSPITYKVSKGDNLNLIARMFKTTTMNIKRSNKLKKNHLYVGQKITIPGSQKGVYTVKRGDNLTKVAKEFNRPVELISKLNDLKGHSLRAGQKIIVNID